MSTLDTEPSYAPASPDVITRVTAAPCDLAVASDPARACPNAGRSAGFFLDVDAEGERYDYRDQAVFLGFWRAGIEEGCALRERTGIGCGGDAPLHAAAAAAHHDHIVWSSDGGRLEVRAFPLH